MGDSSAGSWQSCRRRNVFGGLRFWLLGLDVVLLMGAVLAATWLRYDFHVVTNSAPGLAALLVAGVAGVVLVGGRQGLYTGRWERGSFEEAYSLGVMALAVTVTLFALDFVVDHPLPSSALVASGPIALGAMTGSRALSRVRRVVAESAEPAACRLVVFGAGEGGKYVVGAMLGDRSHCYDPVAFLDDDAEKSNLRLHGIPVRGTRADLERVARESGADTLLVAVPSADASLLRDLTHRGRAAGLAVKVLPPVSAFVDSEPGVRDIRPVSFADLMGRREIEVDLDSIAGYLTGRRVLVTGAGGSIGSELCRQVRRYGPERLVMLDRDESALHALQLSLDGRAMLDERSLVVADIRDRGRLERVLAEHRPDVVFHAAALKHLPLLEMHPEEALKTNVFGTLNLLEAATAAGVRRFVNISTDKAANPVCALGYSKRLAERLTAWFGVTGDDCRYLSVRFGNVLGSRGSVLTAFRQQIADHKPLTVTHPDVSRYFMTVEEAVRLVVQAGAVGRSGQVLVLDMGEPVRIADVAHRLILSSGEDLPVEFTGLRPGEKLHECLLGDGEVDVRPVHPQISHVPAPALHPDDARDLADLFDPEEVLAAMRVSVQAPVRSAARPEVVA